MSKQSNSSNSGWQWGPFVKNDEANPCIEPRTDTSFECPISGKVHWEEKDVFNPAAIVRNGQVHVLYRAEDKAGRYAGTSRVGLASSRDGMHFTRRETPVLYPDRDDFKSLEWEGGCEDPRIVEDENGRYYLTYTSFNGHLARLCIATSDDLIRWEKHGPVFEKAFNGKYRDLWSKSGSIICKLNGERLTAVKINGLYWMYWGESNIYAATSENLMDWTPVERNNEGVKRIYIDGEAGNLLSIPGEPYLFPVFSPRRNRFDSVLVEPGPPAVLSDEGILFLYNSYNSNAFGDKNWPDRTYTPGQALLDPLDPTCLIARCTEPFMLPEEEYEIAGQSGYTCFVEGLAYFKGEWLLYYGTADSSIAVARWRPER